MKLAFSTNAFKRYSLQDAIVEIGNLGYEGVEILCDIPHAYPPNIQPSDANHIKKTLASCGLHISNLNAFTLYALGDVYHPSWIEHDQARRNLRIQHTLDCIDLANKIGAKHLSTEPGGPVLSGTDTAASEKIFLDGIQRISKFAEEKNIKVLVEPEPLLLIENSSQFKKFIRQVDSDSIGLNFDISHFYCVHEDPAKLVLELAEFIEHFHLADIRNRIHNHLIPGHGEIDFRSIFDAMDKIGYDGFVTVELYPYQENPVAAATEAHAYLCSIAEQMS